VSRIQNDTGAACVEEKGPFLRPAVTVSPLLLSERGGGRLRKGEEGLGGKRNRTLMFHLRGTSGKMGKKKSRGKGATPEGAKAREGGKAGVRCLGSNGIDLKPQ